MIKQSGQTYQPIINQNLIVQHGEILDSASNNSKPSTDKPRINILDYKIFSPQAFVESVDDFVDNNASDHFCIDHNVEMANKNQEEVEKENKGSYLHEMNYNMRKRKPDLKTFESFSDDNSFDKNYVPSSRNTDTFSSTRISEARTCDISTEVNK